MIDLKQHFDYSGFEDCPVMSKSGDSILISNTLPLITSI